jgi:hypothetical protein
MFRQQQKLANEAAPGPGMKNRPLIILKVLKEIVTDPRESWMMREMLSVHFSG